MILLYWGQQQRTWPCNVLANPSNVARKAKQFTCAPTEYFLTSLQRAHTTSLAMLATEDENEGLVRLLYYHTKISVFSCDKVVLDSDTWLQCTAGDMQLNPLNVRNVMPSSQIPCDTCHCFLYTFPAWGYPKYVCIRTWPRMVQLKMINIFAMRISI